MALITDALRLFIPSKYPELGDKRTYLTKSFSDIATAFKNFKSTMATLETTPLSPRAAFSVHKNATNQTGVANLTYTQITFGTSLYDVGSHFTSNQWTPPAGKVHLSGAFFATGTIAAGSLTQASIYKNGADFRHASAYSVANSAAAIIAIDDDANGSDVYELRVLLSGLTGTGTIDGNAPNTWFMGHTLL